MTTTRIYIPLVIALIAASTSFSNAQQFGDTHQRQGMAYFFDRSGTLYVWGAVRCFAGDSIDYGYEVLDPIPVKHPRGKKWTKAASGDLANVAYLIDEEGVLYLIGVTEKIGVREYISPEGERYWKDVSVSFENSAFISATGKLYYQGELYESYCANKFVRYDHPVLFPSPPDGSVWEKVSVGTNHFLALSTKGNIFGFGNNCYGQFGCGDTNIHVGPTKMKHPNIEMGRWKSMAAGFESSFCIDQDGNLYHSGSYWHCPKSMVDEKDLCSIRTYPSLITNPKDEKWADVRVAGNGHILGITENGSLYAWGRMSNGVSPFRFERYTDFIPEPLEVPIQDSVTRWIAIGVTALGSLAADQNCRIFAWGLNNSNVLGGGGYVVDTPTIIQRFCQTSYVRPSVNPNVKSVISLLAVHPNPASSNIDISFTLDRNAEVRMDLLDILGKPARTFERLRYEAGEHTITLPLTNLLAGAYIIRLQTNGGIASISLMIE